MAQHKKEPNELIQILDALCKLDFKDNITTTLNLIWKYYNRVKRHNYHIISQYIIKKYKKPKDEEVVSIISENLKTLINEVKEQWGSCEYHNLKAYDCVAIDPPEYSCDGIITYEGEIGSCSDYKELYRFLLKLYDHIQMEIIRLSEIRSENERLIEINRDLKVQLEKSQKRVNCVSKTYHEINNKIEDVESRANNMYLQIISILGIFTAIVFAVFGGLNVINSISSAFLQGDITLYRTILVASMTILFVFLLIFSLLSLARWTSAEEGPGKFAIILCVGVSVACLVGIIWALYQSAGTIT